jgi:class 3 adenylate cyclase
MEATFSSYDFEASRNRIDEILTGADAAYEEKTSIPARTSLTYANGYYVRASALFVDLRRSSELAQAHTRPVLAKIYRAYISEVVAVLKGNFKVQEISIEGDGVWAIFDTPMKSDIDGVLETAARVASLVDALNIKLAAKNYSKIEIGIGLDYGESLYIKAGYNGSGINEVVWIGSVVGTAAHLCKNGNRTYLDREVMVSEAFAQNLKEEYRKLLTWNASRGCHQGDIWNVVMNDWVTQNG